MQDLLIFPYSGTAIETLDCLGEKWKCVGFISDESSLVGKTVFGIEIYDRRALQNFPTAKVLTVHGSPSSYRKREEIFSSLGVPPEKLATVIHPRAAISTNATIGYDVLIMAGVVVTANASIGNHVIVLPNSVIHHDSVVGDFTLVAANVTIAGNVTIGSSCYLGAASSIKNGISIGMESLLGIGANVICSFPAQSKLIGNPAKQLNGS
jgi:sugar O-acyltransferase (sialic acid O-acetyltransferase NeuD family)